MARDRTSGTRRPQNDPWGEASRLEFDERCRGWPAGHQPGVRSAPAGAIVVRPRPPAV